MAISVNLSEFKQDRVFAAFVGDNFNLQNTIASINNLPFTEQLAKISSGIEYVKQSISFLTSQNSEEFFHRTSKLDELYQELQFIQVKSRNLSKTLEGIKYKLEVPYQQLLRQILLISRLQKTCDLLRKMLRVIHLSKRIYEYNLEVFKHEHEQTIYLKEIVKVSQYINEVDLIVASDNEDLLSKLKLISKDLTRIWEIKSNLIPETDHLLAVGLDTGDSNVTSTALQVFNNLGLLEEKVNCLIKDKCSLIGQTVKKCLNNRELKGAKSGLSIAQNNPLRTTLRNCIKSMLEVGATHFNQVCAVVRLLSKRRDNSTQSLLIEFISNKDSLLSDMWTKMVKTMSTILMKQVNESGNLKQLIECDYPAVSVMFLDFWKAISHNEPDVGTEKSVRSILLNFESAYLSTSLSDLFEAVNRIFNETPRVSSKSANLKAASVPSEKDVDTLIGAINHQLSMAKVDSQLTQSVCKNVLQTLNLFIVKCENRALVDGDSTQVIGPFTASQRHNAALTAVLSIFTKQISSSLASYSHQSPLSGPIEKALASIDSLILTIFEPLISSIEEAIEAIILTMHNEDYNTFSNKTEDVSCSLYMKELQRFISRVSQDYLRQFAQCSAIDKRISQMASTTIDTFLLHMCLLTPVSEAGRRKIAADMSQLELAIVPICERMGDLGRSYQILRAFKTLLLLSPEEISKSSVLGNPIPYQLVLHFLISNYAPEELKSPQKYMDWSVTRYIKWLNNSTDHQRITLINDVLDSYVKQVRKSQKTSFSPIYPILVDILKLALADQ